MPGCAAGEIFAVVTLKMMFLLSFLASRAYARTPRKIHPWDFGFGPNYANFVIKIRFFSLRGRILRAGPPPPPLFSVFCFSLPPTTRRLDMELHSTILTHRLPCTCAWHTCAWRSFESGRRRAVKIIENRSLSSYRSPKSPAARGSATAAKKCKKVGLPRC